ncbi:MAG TPA: hypothetical protein VFY84_02145 [Jiangellales bacterium]|nr:hypothetical protein [Jiangellales bacterium]
MTMHGASDTTRAPGGGTGASRPEGPVSAAILAAGVGCLALGVFTTLAEASDAVADWLRWSEAVGPLAGKTAMTVVVWLAAWAGLHLWLRRKPYETTRALTIAAVLIALGVLGTFPTFFQLFAAE